MSLSHSPQIPTNGLNLLLDGGNLKSFLPPGNWPWKNLVNSNNNVSNGGFLSFTTSSNPPFKYFTANGTSNYVRNDTPVLPSGTQDSTIICWCRPDPTAPASTYTGLVSYGGRSNTNSRLLSLNTSGGNTIYVSSAYWSNDYVPDNLLVTPNAWNMVGMITRGAALSNNTTLFCGNANGLNFTTGNSSVSSIQSTISSNLAIGCTDYPGRYFKGGMLAVLIYDRELPQTEIYQVFNAYKGRVGL